MFEEKIHPAHGLYRASFFLNRHILQVNNVAVTLSFEKQRPSAEDGESLGYNYMLTRKDTGQRMSAVTLDWYWRGRCGPDQVDWDSLDLRITASETNDIGVSRQVGICLYGLENCSAVKEQTVDLWVWLVCGDKGFFPADSPIVLEFRRRLAIENAIKRMNDAQKTLDKHLALGPFMTDD